MDLMIIAGVVAFAILVFYVIWTYNLLLRLKMKVARQESHVEVHLKKRYDLIPALIEVVKGYAKHEKGTLEEVTKLRTDWVRARSPEEKLRTSNQLDSALTRLLLVQERYPALKANRNFLSLQRSLTTIENELVHERKVYNKRVSWYNIKTQEFPTTLIARLFGFRERPFFSLGDKQKG